MRLVVVDAANVVGSRPTGWWRDRAGAARRLVERLRVLAGTDQDTRWLVVLEGAARAGAAESSAESPGDRVEVVHAPGSGDDQIVAAVAAASTAPGGLLVVTADRALRDRVTAAGATVTGPSWLWQRLDAVGGSDPDARPDTV
jgi:predicted RNA-binding protein with PIN domain